MTISSRDVALAAEAFNRAPALSPLARRLGLELVNRADRNTGRCKPSEGRLALSLGCDDRSIRRAKVELQRAGFLSWITPGHHKRCWYQIMWSKLVELAQAIKREIKAAAAAAMRNSENVKAVKLRQDMQRARAGAQPAAKADRTVSSCSPSPHNLSSLVQTVTDNFKTGQIRMRRNQASERFWRDLAADSRIFEVVDRITPAMEEAAVEAEMSLFGSGIGLVRQQLALEGGA